MIHIKTCKLCGVKFDIATNFDICPKCRIKKEKRKYGEKRR